MSSKKTNIVSKCNYLLREYNKKQKYEHIPNIIESFVSVKTNSALDKGHETISNIYKALAFIDEFTPRSEFQIKFHVAIIQALVPWIYGDTYESNTIKIHEFNNMVRVYRGVIFPAMRQGGKTEAMNMIIVVLFLCVENINILVVANSETVLNKDTGFIARIKKFFKLFKFDSFTSNNAQHLNACFPDERTISCYSALKGER